jgi:hypothetical protein
MKEQNEFDLKSSANARQVGGNHYKKHLLEHWDTVVLFNLDYFQASTWKYLLRWRDKNGIQDLEKVVHYAQKYLEIEKLRAEGKLTRSILERAILKLEEIEQQEEQAAAYRAQAKGDCPIDDLLSGYPRPIMPADDVIGEDEHGPLRKSDLCADALRDGKIKRRDKCTHGEDDCPVHPNGGCPARHAASASGQPGAPLPAGRQG